MRYLSRHDLQRIADRVVAAYWKLPDAQVESYRIVPELLLNRVLGLEIEHRCLSRDGRTLGLTSFDEIGVEVYGSKSEDIFFLDGKTVLIEKALQESSKVGRYHFTVVHEGCHHVLNMLYPESYGSGVNERRVIAYRSGQHRNTNRDWEEWQVDTMTSYVLMPIPLLMKNLSRCGIKEPIQVLNAVYRRQEYQKFEQVSKLMGVSKQALAIRMMQLGLLEKSYLGNPYDLVRVYVEDGELE